ncbi:MAG TPA: shikimate kinase [Salinimicrobium sp.]|nr:shikimate kinase [Salinimicrobium sp.]
MKIFLCGYMGAGKTTIGKLLAQKLQIPFADLDDVIENSEQKSIPQIFETKSEIYFRKKETEVLMRFLEEKKNIVLSLGGGTPCYGQNLQLIKDNPEIQLVYLKSSAENLTGILSREKNFRPLIQHIQSPEDLLEYIQKHLFERNFYYNQSDFIVSIDNKTPQKVVAEIIERLD